MTQTVFYHSGMSGMPSATLATAGGLTGLLDALLVNGVNLRNVTSLTRVGDTVTAQIDGSNPYSVGEVVEIQGATPTAYSARHRVTAITVNTVSFTLTGNPTTPASGTITIRHPPAGWTRQQFASNVVAYRDGGSLGHYMQVEDNNPYADSAASARTRMAVALSALDTATQLNAQHRIQKANNWALAADSRTVYLVMGSSNMFHFGEFTSYTPTDNYAWHQNRGESGSGSVTVFSAPQVTGRHSPILFWNTSDGAGANGCPISLMRNAAQLVADARGYPFSFAFTPGSSGNVSSYENVARFAVPSAVDGSIPMAPIMMAEGGTGGVDANLRGAFRGAMFPMGRVDFGLFPSSGVIRLDPVVIAGVTRRFAMCRFGGSGAGVIAFDLGNWA